MFELYRPAIQLLVNQIPQVVLYVLECLVKFILSVGKDKLKYFFLTNAPDDLGESNESEKAIS